MNKGSNLRKVFQKTFSEAYGSGGRMIDNDPRNHPDHGITVHSSGQFFKKHAHEDDYGIHQVTTDQDNTLGVRTKPYVVKTVVHDPREAPVIRDTLLRQGINPSILQSQIPSKPLRQNHPSDESHQAALSNYRKMWADKDKATGTLHDLIRQGRVGSYAYTAESKPEVHHPVNPRNFSSLRGLQRPTTHHGWAPIGEKAPDFSHLHARNNPRLPETHTAPDNEDVAANQAYMWASNPKTSSAYPNVSTSEQQEALLKMHQEAKDRAFRDLGLHHVQQNNPNLKLKVEDHAVGGELVKHHMKNMLENHPLFPKGWLRPLVDYKAGKGPRPTSQGSPNPNRAIESTTMSKSQRIRNIFESRIKEDRTTTFTGVDKDSGSYNRVKWQPGPTKGTARLGKYGGTEKLVGGDGTKMSAGYFDKKTAEIASELDHPPAKPKGAQSTEYTAFKAERHKEASKAGEVAAGVKRGQHVTPGQTAQSVYGGTDLEGKPRVTPEQLSKEKLRMSLQHHVNRLRGSNPELAAKYRNLGAKRGMQLASTDHYRAGLRALFETVLDEAKEEGNLQRHPVNKPGDQALHNTLRAHFDSQDPEQAKYLHAKYDTHIKNVHKHRGTDNEATAHANLRGFEHEMLRHAAETGSQGVTKADVKQHRSMLKAGDANDKAGHKEIKTRFYSPEQPDPNPDPA
jgi:hypothetical protein